MAQCVVALDVDCFYAQVAELDLIAKGVFVAGTPLAVKQKRLLVTANYAFRWAYEARTKSSWKKCGSMARALEVLGGAATVVDGEDVLPFLQASCAIRDVLKAFGPVERSGSDEFYVDVSAYARRNVADAATAAGAGAHGAAGACGEDGIYGDALLSAGACVAVEIRRAVREATGLTMSAGIAANKLLAKFAASKNKPDGQTVVFSEEAEAFSRKQPWLSIPGVGRSSTSSRWRPVFENFFTAKELPIGETCGEVIDLATVAELDKLEFHVREALHGRDARAVSETGDPKSCSIEETWPEHAGGALEVRSVAGALLNSRKLCRGLLLRLVWQKQYFGNVFTKVTVTARRLHQRSETAAAFDVPHGVRKFVFQETRNDLTAADFDRDNDPLHAVNAAFADLVSAKLRRWLKAPGSVAMLCLTASGGLRCGDIGQLFNAAPRLAAPAAALDSAPLASAPLASAPSPAEGLPPQTTMKPPNPSTTRKRPANIADAAAPQAKGARSAHATAQRPADRAAAKAKAPRTWAEPATSSEPPRTSPLSDAEWHCSLCTYRHAGAQSAFLACAVCRAPKQ